MNSPDQGTIRANIFSERVVIQMVYVDGPSRHKTSVSSLHSLVLPSNPSRHHSKAMPCMSQPYFIALWKTLYDMFHAEPEDEETYHFIASIGKLLKKIYLSRSLNFV
jgi:hypothetical protein